MAKTLNADKFRAELAALAAGLRRTIEADCAAFPVDATASAERRRRVQHDFPFFRRTYFPHYTRGKDGQPLVQGVFTDGPYIARRQPHPAAAGHSVDLVRQRLTAFPLRCACHRAHGCLDGGHDAGKRGAILEERSLVHKISFACPNSAELWTLTFSLWAVNLFSVRKTNRPRLLLT